MSVFDPHHVLVSEIVEKVSLALQSESKVALEVELAPGGYGDLTVNLHRVTRDSSTAASIAERLAKEIDGKLKFVGGVKAMGGFLNFTVNPATYGPLVWSSVREVGEMYGFNPAASPLKILLEHTSANPVHPLHVGHLRNSVIGDALARLLRARGHVVETHFYVDDVGLQVSYAAYGYEKVRDLRRNLKPDHFIGLVYSMTNAIVNVISLERKRLEARSPEEAARVSRELSEWLWVSKELMERDPELFSRLSEAIRRDGDPIGRIYSINRAYERGEPWAVKLVREVVNMCVEGFRETLGMLGISFDEWDLESEVTVWNGLTETVLERLRSSGLARREDGAWVVSFDEVAERAGGVLGVPPGKVPPLTLVRSDGTTLYATRDIAYTIWKFSRGFDRVVNVIAVQQSLEQLQVRLTLYMMGMVKEAANMVHYSYEMVHVSGMRMSGRRGRYISADELLEESVRRAREELERRKADVEDPEDTSKKVGIAALKYSMLSVSPGKTLSFSWDRVLDFERNSGPFIQYAYVRSASLLNKAREQGLKPELDERMLGEEERRLVFLTGYFPHGLAEAADNLRVEWLAQFLNDYAIEFNKYYDNVPVLKAGERAATRLAVVEMASLVLRRGMELMGITPPKRM